MTNIMINSLSNAIQDAIIEKLRQMGEIHYNLKSFKIKPIADRFSVPI